MFFFGLGKAGLLAVEIANIFPFAVLELSKDRVNIRRGLLEGVHPKGSPSILASCLQWPTTCRNEKPKRRTTVQQCSSPCDDSQELAYSSNPELDGLITGQFPVS